MISSAHKRASDVTKTSAARETARLIGLVLNVISLDFLVCDVVLTHESCLVPRDGCSRFL